MALEEALDDEFSRRHLKTVQAANHGQMQADLQLSETRENTPVSGGWDERVESVDVEKSMGLRRCISCASPSAASSQLGGRSLSRITRPAASKPSS